MEPDKTAIAIIGMAGRFPNARNLQEFWRNLEQGRESLIEFSDQDLLDAGVPRELIADPNYVKRGTVLEGADLFDAGFFGFNPREAEVIDPQQRVFLECAWEALEDAGYAGESLPDSVGVFAGSSINSYLLNNILSNPSAIASVSPYQLMLASDKDFLATRVAYKLNLRGPAMSVQTACSTSLVAVNVACQHILQGACTVAMAGGVSITFPERAGYLYSEGMILSTDGHCRPFDADGRGIRPGAGSAVIVLKPLAEAIRDGDQIRAIIRGFATNNDGATKMGFTAPSVEGQARAILAAQKMAGVAPESISYIEAHGTATPLGDPIEIAALAKAFGTTERHYCPIGSVKSNLGHLDAAAGIAGLVKTVLALEHKAIPASLHFRKPNPQIDFENSPFFVNSELRPWTTNGAARRAGVSSFGIGGTNAHTILEEAPEPIPQSKTWPCALVTLSARSQESLDTLTDQLRARLEEDPHLDLFDACYTLQLGRKHFPFRRTAVAANKADTVALLQSQKAPSRQWDGTVRPVVFMFSGQGSQHRGMGERLYAADPTFRSAFDTCAEILKPFLNVDLREVVYGSDITAEVLGETRLAQPALFAVEYALARMWMSWGVTPAVMIGHSIGEYAAACISGVFALEDALKVVAVRGSLMQDMPRGSMLAVAMPELRLRPLCLGELSSGGIELAAVNAPNLCTLAGPDDAIDSLRRKIEAQGISCRRINTSHAFHSASMDGVLQSFTQVLKGVRLGPPAIPFVSNLTGRLITSADATDPSYWASHLRHTVRFADGLRELTSANSPILLEVGPGDVLSTFAKQSDARQSGGATSEIVSSLPHPQGTVPDTEHLLASLGRLWSAGVPVNWAAFHGHERLRRVSLPTCPFERQRYFIEPKPRAAAESPRVVPARPHPKDWFYIPSWNPTPMPVKQSPNSTAGEENWLVFVSSGHTSAAVVEALAGQRVATVKAGSEYSRAAAGVYTIVPGNRDHYQRLVRDLAADGYDPDNVMHLWNAASGTESPVAPADAGFFSLLFLGQAFGDAGDSKRRRIVAVSEGLHNVTGAEPTVPEKALSLAPVKVIPRELPFLWTRSVDFPSSASPQQLRDYAANVVLEPLLEHGARITAYRGSSRWEQSYRPQPLDQPKQGLALRANGVYLITGGLGGIGLVLARHFAEHAQARLVLTTRSPFPQRAEWERWTETHETTDPTTQKIRELLAIEAAGAQVQVGVADVADESAMERVVQEARRRFGPINGVIHAAGIPGGGTIDLKTREDIEAVLAPKVHGTWVLERLLAPDHPDFLVLCSSFGAIVGRAGSIDYCAANLFLDAYATSAHQLPGTHVVSIGWDAWREAGMARNAAVPEGMRAAHFRYLEDGIGNEEGLAALTTILSTSLPNVAVIPRDLSTILAQAESIASPLPSPSNTASRNGFSPTEQQIASIWEEMLGARNITLDANFFELGGHSLLGTSILSRIKKQYGINAPLRVLFEAPTIRELADRVDTLLWATQANTPVHADSEDREEIEL
jgi:acyl transferase domain-containing protein/acyl carrier protein